MSELTDFLLARIAEDANWTGGTAGSAAVAYGRVVRTCRAHQRIVERLGGCGDHAWAGNFQMTCDDCETLKLLALPYADHPDYRDEEWKP